MPAAARRQQKVFNKMLLHPALRCAYMGGMENALHRAIIMAGGQASLARAIGITQAAVWNWTKRGKRVPVKHLAAVERVTGIARAELRPDIFGA